MKRLLFLLFLASCKREEPSQSGQHLVPIDAGADATPWQSIIICQGDVKCRETDDLTVCTTRDPACRIVPATSIDAGAVDATFPSNFAEAPAS